MQWTSFCSQMHWLIGQLEEFLIFMVQPFPFDFSNLYAFVSQLTKFFKSCCTFIVDIFEYKNNWILWMYRQQESFRTVDVSKFILSFPHLYFCFLQFSWVPLHRMLFLNTRMLLENHICRLIGHLDFICVAGDMEVWKLLKLLWKKWDNMTCLKMCNGM